MEPLSPVFALPPELLSECFLSCAATVPYTFGMLPSPYAWITISHVCRHWRNVALSYAKLWSRIRLTSHREWMQELLRRSGDAPLEVLADFPLIYENPQRRADWMAAFRVVLEEIARIRILVISSQQKLESETLALLNRPAPLLKDLRLYHLVFDCESQALGFMSRNSNATSLESLSLYKCHIPWFALDIHTLKELTIVGLPWGGVSHSLNMPTLVQILRSTPLLESFVIRSALPPLSTIYSSPIEGPPVELVHLHTLKLYGCTTDVIKLLGHLQLPALRSLFMALDSPLLDTPERFAASVVQTVLAPGELTSLHIKGEGYVNFTLEGHVTRAAPPSPPPPGATPPETRTFHLTVSSTHCRRLLSAFVVHPALCRARTLHVTSLCRKRIWVLVFAHFRDVAELAVRGKRATKILHRMFADPPAAPDAGEGAEPAPVSFPRLRSLLLGNLREQGVEPGDESHELVRFWRGKLEDRRSTDDRSSVSIKEMVVHDGVPHTLRKLDLALVPQTDVIEV